MAEENKTPETIEVRMTESFSTWVVRESITLNVADYPELEGKTEEEIMDYISENAENMKPSNEDVYSDLREELFDQDVIREKITNEETEIEFE